MRSFMNISHHHGVGNSTKLFAVQGTNQSNYLEPDYFLPSSSNSSYYSRKYSSKTNYHNLNFKSKSSKIARIVSSSLLAAMMLTATLDAKAHPSIEPNPSFLFGKDSAGMSTNVPLPPIMPQSPPAPPMPPVPPAMPNFISDANIAGKADNRSAFLESIRNFGKNILKKVKKEPKPKVKSSDVGDLISQLHSTLERRRNGISEESSGTKPKKVVKQAPKLTADEQARKKAENLARAATIREKNKKKWEEAARKNEEIARERRRVEAEAVKARLEQKAKERGEHREGIVNGIDPALHHNIVSDLRSEIALLREQLKNQGSTNVAITTGNVSEEPIYSKPIDTISIASSSVTEYSEPWQDPDTPIGEAFESEFSTSNVQKQHEPSAPPLSSFSSSEDLHISETNSLSEEEEKVIKMLDDAIEDSGSSCGGVDDWSGEDSILDTDGYDTDTSSGSEYSEDSGDEDELPFSPPPSEEELAELDKLSEVSNPEQTLVTTMASISSEIQEESEYHGDSDILTQETVADDDIQNSITEADAAPSNESCVQATSMDKEELRKKAEAIAAINNQTRKISKIASHQIRHRIFVRDIVTAAVAAGDEADDATDDAAENTPSYSVWSSGTLGSHKQKSHINSDGYSSKITGGTIGADINLENDLLLGASFSKFNSRVKYQDQGGASDLRSRTASTRAKYDTHIFSLYGLSPVSHNISLALIGSAGHSKGKKVRSKLLSFEQHLNYKLKLPREVTLIPHIGLRYEYEKVSRHKEQIASNLSIERSKKSYQALSGEIGSRVIFAPIKLKSSAPSSISITPTAHFSVERRIGSRGKSNPFTLTYYEAQQTIGTGIVSANAQNERTDLNAGIGLIASRKNIKLELLYDQQRQKRFKSHQGVLKLKVSL